VKKTDSNEGCDFCHSVESWSSVTFDHSGTNFPLQGKHLSIQCSRCHKKIDNEYSQGEIRFILNQKNCQDCHQDIHMGQFTSEESGLIKNCQDCHQSLGWSELLFEHNRDSGFKLEGAHKNLACSKCHLPSEIQGQMTVRYRPLKKSCNACHAGRSMKEGNKI
jgi:hypothetical protein